jgi:hypothetical protein
MTSVEVELSNYRDRVGQRVAPGRYRVRVDDTELDKSSAGNQMINLWLRVVGGEFNDAIIVDRLVLTEKSLFRVVGFLQAIGIPTPKKKIRLDLRAFLNKELEVDVEDGDPYNGRVKSEVRGYFKVEQPAGAKKMTAAEQEDAMLAFEEGAANGDAATADVPDDVDLDTIDL